MMTMKFELLSSVKVDCSGAVALNIHYKKVKDIF